MLFNYLRIKKNREKKLKLDHKNYGYMVFLFFFIYCKEFTRVIPLTYLSHSLEESVCPRCHQTEWMQHAVFSHLPPLPAPLQQIIHWSYLTISQKNVSQDRPSSHLEYIPYSCTVAYQIINSDISIENIIRIHGLASTLTTYFPQTSSVILITMNISIRISQHDVSKFFFLDLNCLLFCRKSNLNLSRIFTENSQSRPHK